MKLPLRPMGFAALAALALVSCSETVRVVVPKAQPYSATTPQNVVKAFEWAVNNRSIEVLEELFTEDFVFISATTDSAGNPTRDVIGDRAWILDRLRCMLAGDFAAQRVQLMLDRNLVPLPDPRPGYVDSLFKTIRTSVDFRCEIGDGSTFETTGYALFSMTRGDTAAIPPELVPRGFTRDKARWWISRWEDETIAYGKPHGATDPTKSITIGAVLKLYDCSP